MQHHNILGRWILVTPIPMFATDEFAKLMGLKIVQVHPRLSGGTPATTSPRIAGTLKDRIFSSPGVGTFGGIFNLDTGDFNQGISSVIGELKSVHSVEELLILLPSDHLSDLYPETLKEILAKFGGVVEFQDLNHVIEMADWSRTLLSRGNQKKLRQCNENNFEFRMITDGELSDLYEVLCLNREGIGATISMTLGQIEDSFKNFPEKYFSFGVFSSKQLIAGAICVETAPRNLYVYMWGDDVNFRRFSPITFLCSSLIDFGSSRNFQYLDLGTSSIDGKILEGVARYKENLGANGFDKSYIRLVL